MCTTTVQQKAPARPAMSGRQAIQEKLAREVLRKLRLATAADEKEGRQIICQEVFTDITGTLDEGAQEKLLVTGQYRFYEVLAPYFREKGDSAEALLYVSRQLWGQPYIAPIFALLLHQWLFRKPDAGGTDQRQKHINVLTSGARQLFWGDAHASLYNFRPLFSFLADLVVLSPDRRRLDSLPGPSRNGLLAVVASFLPYYTPAEALAHTMEVFPSPDHTLDEGGHVAGEATDYCLTHLTETLRQLKPEASLLTFLASLRGLRGCPFLAATRTITRLRLQAELYSLTTLGGPRYPPKSVNAAAFRALDALFPSGQRSRRLISLAFRMWLHPLDALKRGVQAIKAALLAPWYGLRYTCRVVTGTFWRALSWRPWRSPWRRMHQH